MVGKVSECGDFNVVRCVQERRSARAAIDMWTIFHLNGS